MSCRVFAKILGLVTGSLLLAPGAYAAGPQTTDAGVQKALVAIDELAQKQIDQNSAVGLAIGVVYKDKTVFAKGFGLREVGKEAKVDADTVFQLASVSKPIGATVIASLIGDGKISWDSKINDLDPDFRMFDPWVTRELTIRDLYAHRSGLPDHAGDLLEDMGYDRAQVLYRLRFQKPNSSFRSHYEYTNFGITEAAVAAARAYGLTWEDASQKKLYAPAGMKATSSRYADFLARANKALGHVQVDGKWVQKYHRDPDAQSPAGGVSSSVNDMAQWMRLQLANGRLAGKQVVPEAPLLETRHPEMLTQFNPLNGLPGFYGLGMNVSYTEHGQLHLSHSGGFELGAATCVSFMPGEQLGIIVLTNGYPTGVAEALAASFFDFALYGKQTQDWFALYKKAMGGLFEVKAEFDYSRTPASFSPSLPDSEYVGTYTNDFVGDIAIVEREGGLAMVQGPKGVSFPIRHYDRDTFTYETAGENAVGTSGIVFSIDAAGRATGVTINSLNTYGTGIFRRVPKAR